MPLPTSQKIGLSLIIGVSGIILLAIGWSLRSYERSLIAASAIVLGLEGSTAAIRYDYDFETHRPSGSVEGAGSMEMALELPSGMQQPDPGDSITIYIPPGKPYDARLQPPSTQLANNLLIAGIFGIAIAGLVLLLRPRTKAD